MDSSDSSCQHISLAAISLKALVEKEDRQQYRVVAEGRELTKSYAIFDARFNSSCTATTTISLPIHSRLDAVEVLMRCVEMFGEDREIVSVAMSFLDRFVALESERFVKNGFDHEFKNGHGPFPNSIAQQREKSDDKNYCLAMFVLVSLDLAIRLYSPTSGDAFRNAVQRVSDTTSIDPSATSMTLSNDIEIMGTAAAAAATGTGNCDAQEQNHHDLFFQEVKKEFYGDKIYHSTKFNSLRRLSNHQQTQDFGNAQYILMQRLDFYLCPVQATTIVQYLLQSMETELSLLDLKYDFHTETILYDYSIYQVELSSYCPTMVNIKPSIIAFSAITNAMKVFLPRVTKVLRDHLSKMCANTLGLPVHSQETKCIRRLLFHMWKDNYPDSIQSLENNNHHQQQQYMEEEESKTPINCKVTFAAASRVSPDTVAAVVDQNDDDLILDLPSIAHCRGHGTTNKRPKVSMMDVAYSDFMPISG